MVNPAVYLRCCALVKDPKQRPSRVERIELERWVTNLIAWVRHFVRTGESEKAAEFAYHLTRAGRCLLPRKDLADG